MNKSDAETMTLKTIAHYASSPEGFWENTKTHDVSQNINATLRNIKSRPPFTILDFGCGPGRDLKNFKDLGHQPYGLEGCEKFCSMARAYSGCEVYHQNFLNCDLPFSFFDGIFANASIFHLPKKYLPGLLKSLHTSLKKDGILFSSNPRGNGEFMDGSRYANFMELGEYRDIVESAGFKLIDHYYRPQGRPVEDCPWLACIFRKT